MKSGSRGEFCNQQEPRSVVFHPWWWIQRSFFTQQCSNNASAIHKERNVYKIEHCEPLLGHVADECLIKWCCAFYRISNLQARPRSDPPQKYTRVWSELNLKYWLKHRCFESLFHISGTLLHLKTRSQWWLG